MQPGGATGSNPALSAIYVYNSILYVMFPSLHFITIALVFEREFWLLIVLFWSVLGHQVAQILGSVYGGSPHRLPPLTVAQNPQRMPSLHDAAHGSHAEVAGLQNCSNSAKLQL